MSATSALSVVFALLAAGSNAAGTVLQRRAALTVPSADSFRLRLMIDLLKHPVWLGGILAVIFAALFQAAALATGPLAVVQPIFVLELPCALFIAGLVWRKSMNRQVWVPVGCIVAGLAMALVAARPSGGTPQAPMPLWILSLVCCLGAVFVLCVAALRRPFGPARAACLGLATAIAYALTAALMKSATDTLDRHGVAAFFEAWQTYAFAAVGVLGLFLLENAMQSGPLVASQPALTLGDALISLSLGVTLYSESVRTGWFLVPEIIGAGLVLFGAVSLSRMPSMKSLMTQAGSESRTVAGGAPQPAARPGAAQQGAARSAAQPTPRPRGEGSTEVRGLARETVDTET